MTDEMSTLIIYSLAGIGVIAAIIAFFRTPPGQRYRIAPRISLDEQLKSFPASAEAVIIKGNKKRVLVKAAPYIIVGVVMAGFVQWITSMRNPQCETLFGVNAVYIMLLLASYGIPIACLIVSLLYAATGIKIIKTGYSPPLDSIVFHDTIAKKGVFSTMQGIILVLMPVLSLYLLQLGSNLHTAFAGKKNGEDKYEMIEKLEAKCPDHKRP